MNNTLMDYAGNTIAVGSKSFATAAKLFDATTRRSVLMLYAWCRHCDDVIDDQVLGFNVEARDDSLAEQRLERLKNQTRRAWEGATMTEPAFAAFQEVALGHNIPLQLPLAHLDGFAMDVRETRYKTFEDTLLYCYRVAGVVGLMMARVMGVRNDAVLDRACDLGLAFQLTNIARDIIDDARVGRCYLPADWLAEAGVKPDEIAEPGNRQPIARLAQRLVAEAEPYYASARAGLAGLPLRSAWAIASAHGVYREIGVKVSAAGEQAWDKRQGTSALEKSALLIKGGALAVTSRFGSPTPRPAGLWQRPSLQSE